MMPGPVARAVRGGLRRRRVQAVVICLVLLVSTGASVLALALVADSNAPFDRAFVAQRGADIVATVNTARVTVAELTATARLPGVAAAAGPFAEATITPRVRPPSSGPGGNSAGPTFPPITLAGRASPGGAVDDLALQSGHWADRPGQVVLDNSQGGGFDIGLPLGTRITVAGLPGTPTLTVVGYANSVTSSADGWVTPGEIARLRRAGAAGTSQMLYRFASASSQAVLRSDLATVARALPAGAVSGSASYLSAQLAESGNIAPFVPFVVAFGVIGIVMSVLITGNVVSGAVVAGYRRIGVLKSIGFSPGQVVAAYTGQVAVPAVAGCAAGVVVGNLLAAPMLAQTSSAYGVGHLGVPLWVDVTVPLGLCCLVGIAALLPALRAGRLSAIQAIATGRAPRTGRGYAAHRVLGRVPLPRAVTVGLAAPFARPARTVVTLAAVLLGATAVTFAVGLSISLNLVVAGLSHAAEQQVQVIIPGRGPGGGPGVHVKVGPGGPHPVAPPSAAQVERTVPAALAAQPGTLHYAGQASQLVGVAGLSQQVMATVFFGHAGWTGYDLISGHWYTGPGQVDVPTYFLSATGDTVGDSVTILTGGRQIHARIVGQVFSTANNGLALYTDSRTLSGAIRGLAPARYDVGLRPGTSAAAYTQSLSGRLGPGYFVTPNLRHSGELTLMIGLIGTLTLLLAVVAGLGVLNTVVLHARERVHDLGIFKAIGMTPRQSTAMVVCWVAGTGLLAGLIAVPAGIVLHRSVLPAMAAGAGVGLPASILNVYTVPELAGLALAGVAIAVAGALLPASWAAAARTATALRAE